MHFFLTHISILSLRLNRHRPLRVREHLFISFLLVARRGVALGFAACVA